MLEDGTGAQAFVENGFYYSDQSCKKKLKKVWLYGSKSCDDNNRAYYLGDNGKPVKGFKNVEGQKYLFDKDTGRLSTASGTYKVRSGSFDLYCLGMFAPEAAPCREFSIHFDEMEGYAEWVSVDNTACRVEFALDGSRRYNRFRSPWQFAEKCYANGVWESDTCFRLEELWPENNSTKTLWFEFSDGGCSVFQVKGGLPGQPITKLETIGVKLV